MRMIDRIRDQKGLSLLESTLGILILAVGFMGMMPLMTTATANTLNSDYKVTSTYLANEKLEQVIADKEFQGYSWVTTARYANETITYGAIAYTRSVVVYEVSAADLTTAQASSGYKRVNVTVSWGNTPASSLTMPTLLTNY